MNLFEAFLYGAVQGITEYLPVSSSAHLILLPKFLGTQDPGLTFDVFLHIGTLFSTLIYFRADWWAVLQDFLTDFRKIFGRAGAVSSSGSGPRAVQGLVSWRMIALATIPALAAGALLKPLIETVFRGVDVIAWALIVGGVLLFFVDRFSRGTRDLGQAGFRDALGVGLAQCLSLVPGMSRSGSTMIGGRLMGLDRYSAARFSFLISAPVTLAAIIFELRHWGELVSGAVGLAPLMVALLSSFVFGMLAIGGLLRILRRFGFLGFAVYRVVLGAFLL